MKMEKKKVAAMEEAAATATTAAESAKRKMKDNEYEVDTKVYWQRHYERTTARDIDRGFIVYLSTSIYPLVKRIIRLDPFCSVATDVVKCRDALDVDDEVISNRDGLNVDDDEIISIVRRPKKKKRN